MLITEKYKELNRQAHLDPAIKYGNSGRRWVDKIEFAQRKWSCRTWLDYGCGKGKLGKKFFVKFPEANMELTEYDPCIPGKEKLPVGKFDLVTCTDVLEHIEPECLDTVLQHLFSFPKKVVFLNIATRDSLKKFSDGRSYHLIVQPPIYWLKIIRKFTTWNIEKAPGTVAWDFNLWIYS